MKRTKELLESLKQSVKDSKTKHLSNSFWEKESEYIIKLQQVNKEIRYLISMSDEKYYKQFDL